MHRGNDTRFYLEKGFRVVAVDANPERIVDAEQRFASEIADGSLVIEHAAITTAERPVMFGICVDNPEWSSMDPGFIGRNRRLGAEYEFVEVPGVRFESILAKHGVPYYLKVDIEGLDVLCVHALGALARRPGFFSLESSATSSSATLRQSLEEVLLLWKAGYRSFKFVNQRTVPRTRLPVPSREGAQIDHAFRSGDSGAFGRDIPGRWHGTVYALAAATLLRLEHEFAGPAGRWSRSKPAFVYRGISKVVFRRPVGWYDLHAGLGPPKDGRLRAQPSTLVAPAPE